MHPDSTTVVWPLYRQDGTVVAYTLIDACDVPLVAASVWRLGTTGYAVRCQRVNGKLRKIALAREILGLPQASHDLCADHISGDTLDNRRANLRAVTYAQNSQNRVHKRGTPSSPQRGVYWHIGKQRWIAKIKLNRRYVWHGTFHTEASATAAVVAKRRELMPYSTT